MNEFKHNVHLITARSTPETKAAAEQFMKWRYDRDMRAYAKRIGWHRYAAKQVLSYIGLRLMWGRWDQKTGWRIKIARWFNKMSVRVTYDRKTYKRIFG
jgi:hypothetical protein